jgi:hypothetical protein
MSLEKMYSSRPFKAMAALLFGVMVLSACQETAKQVTQNSSSTPIVENSVEIQASSFKERAIKGELTSTENEMIIAFAQAPATRKLIEINNAATLRVYNAIQAGKGEALQKAFQGEREDEILHLLGYSKQEMANIIAEVRVANNDLYKQLGNSKDLFVSYAKTEPSKCKTCNGKEQFLTTIQKMKTIDINNLLVPVPPENVKIVFGSSKGSLQQGCSWFEWWNTAAFAAWTAGCFLEFAACISGAAAIAGSVGSVVPGVGTAVGLVIGAVLAFFPCAVQSDACVRDGHCRICGEECP